MAPKGMEDDKPLSSLQILRGTAAVVVAFYHSYLIIAQPEYIGEEVFAPLASRGWLGVNLFFILSGFIILFAHHGDLGNARALSTYAIKRFIRIYPIYWIFTALYIATAAAGIGHPDFSWNSLNLISAVSLVHLMDPLTLPLRVAWTLFYEVTFYVAFALFLINVRLGVVVFAAWSAAVLVAVFGFDYRDMGLLNAWNLYFPVGMLCYLAYRRLPSRGGLLAFGVGCLSFVALASTYLGERETFSDKDPWSVVAFMLPCALVVTGAAVMERHHRWSAPRPLLLLGEASYSVYLVHSGVISLFAILYAKLQLTFVPPSLFFFVVAFSSVAAGIIAHKIIELPLLRLLRSRLVGYSAGTKRVRMPMVEKAVRDKI